MKSRIHALLHPRRVGVCWYLNLLLHSLQEIDDTTNRVLLGAQLNCTSADRSPNQHCDRSSLSKHVYLLREVQICDRYFISNYCAFHFKQEDRRQQLRKMHVLNEMLFFVHNIDLLHPSVASDAASSKASERCKLRVESANRSKGYPQMRLRKAAGTSLQLD